MTTKYHIHAAVKEKNVEEVKKLILKGYDVNVLKKESMYWKTPLVIAVEGNDVEMVKVLLKVPTTEVNLGRKKDLANVEETPLYIASEKNFDGIVRRLLKDDNIKVDLGKEKLQVKIKSKDVVKKERKESPLQIALRRKSYECVPMLLAAGADTTKLDGWNRNKTCGECCAGDQRLLLMLSASGVEIKKVAKGETQKPLPIPTRKKRKKLAIPGAVKMPMMGAVKMPMIPVRRNRKPKPKMEEPKEEGVVDSAKGREDAKEIEKLKSMMGKLQKMNKMREDAMKIKDRKLIQKDAEVKKLKGELQAKDVENEKLQEKVKNLEAEKETAAAKIKSLELQLASTGDAGTEKEVAEVVEEKPAEDLFRAKFNYAAGGDDELTFTKGDIIVLIRKDEEAWWTGRLQGTEKEGLFPYNYVVKI